MPSVGSSAVASKVQAATAGTGAGGAIMALLVWWLTDPQFGVNWVIPDHIIIAGTTLLAAIGAYGFGWLKRENKHFPDAPAQ